MGDIVRRAKGGKFIGWSVRFKDADGQRKIRASHQPTREQARRYLVEIEARIARGLVGIPEPPAPSPTVGVLVERFLVEYSRPKIKDLASYKLHARKYLRMVIPLLGKRSADLVTGDEVARVRDSLSRKYAAGTVRVCLAYVATLYAWAIKQGIVAENPVKGVERPVVQGSIDYYTRDETVDLLRLASERATTGAIGEKLLAGCIHLAVHTGLRKGELLGLRWQDLDLDAQRLTVARSYGKLPKGGQVRHLRLPSVCVPVLREWRRVCPRSTEGRVFPIDCGTLDGKTPELLTAAGVRVPAHPWHAMRHTFASHFIMSGGNILTLQRILGHSDVKMTLVYAHLAPDFLGTEMERVRF